MTYSLEKGLNVSTVAGGKPRIGRFKQGFPSSMERLPAMPVGGILLRKQQLANGIGQAKRVGYVVLAMRHLRSQPPRDDLVVHPIG